MSCVAASKGAGTPRHGRETGSGSAGALRVCRPSVGYCSDCVELELVHQGRRVPALGLAAEKTPAQLHHRIRKHVEVRVQERVDVTVR